MSKERMCEICGKHPVAHRDYRFIDSCGLQGKVFVCKFCVGLNDVAIRHIVRKELDPREFYDDIDACDNCASYDVWRNSSGEQQCDNCGYDEGND